MASEQNHPWCRDVSRDEAIRAAEDDAANWRRLEPCEIVKEGDQYLSNGGTWITVLQGGESVPVSRPFRRRRVPLPDHRDLPQAVKELRERVGRLEEPTVAAKITKRVKEFLDWLESDPTPADFAVRIANGLWSDKPAPTPPPPPQQITEGDTLATVRDDGGRPMPKGPPPGLKSHPQPADGLRTERVTLEVTHGSSTPASQWEWKYHIRPRNLFESVRVVEDATLGSGDVFRDVGCGSTRDEITRLTAERDAAREECDRLRVSQVKAAQERDRAHEARGRIRSQWERRGKSLHIAYANIGALKARVAELEASAAANAGGEQQEPPRGWLTPEERRLIEIAVKAHHCPFDITGTSQYNASVLRDLLARSTPPKVKMPPAAQGETPLVRDLMWGQAIREAGGEVQDG